jgi:hypothetical protein
MNHLDDTRPVTAQQFFDKWRELGKNPEYAVNPLAEDYVKLYAEAFEQAIFTNSKKFGVTTKNHDTIRLVQDNNSPDPTETFFEAFALNSQNLAMLLTAAKRAEAGHHAKVLKTLRGHADATFNEEKQELMRIKANTAMDKLFDATSEALYQQRESTLSPASTGIGGAPNITTLSR